MTNERIIRNYFSNWAKKDWNAVEGALADGFVFTSPFDDQIDKRTYQQKCWPHAEEVERYDVDKVIENGSEAFVRYQCWMKDGKSIRCTEYFKFINGKIAEIDVFWGGSQGVKEYTPC